MPLTPLNPSVNVIIKQKQDDNEEQLKPFTRTSVIREPSGNLLSDALNELREQAKKERAEEYEFEIIKSEN